MFGRCFYFDADTLEIANKVLEVFEEFLNTPLKDIEPD